MMQFAIIINLSIISVKLAVKIIWCVRLSAERNHRGRGDRPACRSVLQAAGQTIRNPWRLIQLKAETLCHTYGLRSPWAHLISHDPVQSSASYKHRGALPLCETSPLSKDIRWPRRVLSGETEVGFTSSHCCALKIHAHACTQGRSIPNDIMHRKRRIFFLHCRKCPPYVGDLCCQVTASLADFELPPPTLSHRWSETHLSYSWNMASAVMFCQRAIQIFLKTMQNDVGYKKVHLREGNRPGSWKKSVPDFYCLFKSLSLAT